MFKKVVKKSIDFTFTVIILLALALLVTNFIGFKCYVVRSGSMEPEIHAASVAVVNENVDFYDIEIGDVIAFKLQTGELVTHRVIDETKIDGITYLMTKGDNNEVADGYTTNIQNYFGKTMFSIPELGYFVDWFNSVTGKITIVSICILLILLSVLLDEEEDTIVHHCFNIKANEDGKMLLISDVLPEGLHYVEGTAMLNGQEDEDAEYDPKTRTLIIAPVEADMVDVMIEFDATTGDYEAPEEKEDEEVENEEETQEPAVEDETKTEDMPEFTSEVEDTEA